jgi:small-conductance mechanosensitive channel
VRGANGVLADKPVEVLFVDWGESTRTIRVRWWIDNFHQELQMKDKVNVALESALDKAKIDMPFTTYALNVKMTESIDQPAAQQPQTLAE